MTSWFAHLILNGRINKLEIIFDFRESTNVGSDKFQLDNKQS